MRIIRTEMYFDELSIRTHQRRYWRGTPEREESNGGLAFAWFHSETAGPFDIADDTVFNVRQIRADQVDAVLDMLLLDRNWADIELDLGGGGLFPPEGIRNAALVEFVQSQPIVIE
jgi:hypothetical protein